MSGEDDANDGNPGHELQRVKVYRLNDEGHWLDFGTGHVRVEYLERSTDLGLVVISEGDNCTPLLIHRISKENAYQRQGDDTIITWSDPDIGTDIALSFQEPQGCNFIWEELQSIQDGSINGPLLSAAAAAAAEGHNRATATNGEMFLSHQHHHQHHSQMHHHFSSGNGIIDEFDAVSAAHFEDLARDHNHVLMMSVPHINLPDPDLASLSDIAKELANASVFQRDVLASQLQVPGYMTKLLETFRTAEDLEDEETLMAAYVCIKSAIMLGDTGLDELMFSDECILDVMGALEYEPGVAVDARPKHREFLKEQANFKEVVPIQDAAVKGKIHQTFRVNYIKDVVLPHVLDDASFSTLSSMVMFNSIDILQGLQADATFFPGLFAQLKSVPTTTEEWRDLVTFLQELCSTVKHLNPGQRNDILLRLADLGLFDVMTAVMGSDDVEAQFKAADIMLTDVSHDPRNLRNFLYKQEDNELFTLLVNALLGNKASETSGLQEQVLDMLRMLLDPESLPTMPEKDNFVNLFYEKYIEKLVNALENAAEKPDDPEAVSAATIAHIVDLLCFCVTQHSYRIKYYVLRTDVMQKVVKLLKRKERWIVLAGLRFLRMCLSLKDEFYNRKFVKEGLLEPIIKVFLDNGTKYNLLNSAVLEFFHFIWKQNMKGLLAAIVNSPQWADLEAKNSEYTDMFVQMKQRHEANVEGRSVGGAHDEEAAQQHAAQQQREAAAAEERKRRGERQVDDNEENYFKESGSSDDDDGGGGGGAAGAPRDASHPPDHDMTTPQDNGFVGPLPPFQRPPPMMHDNNGLGRLVDYDDDDDEDDLTFGRVTLNSAASTPKRSADAGSGGFNIEKRQKSEERIVLKIDGSSISKDRLT